MCRFVSCVCYVLFCLFFFKQKTAYEMRISDWSSDVCSSDLTCRETATGAEPTQFDEGAQGSCRRRPELAQPSDSTGRWCLRGRHGTPRMPAVDRKSVV